MTTVLLPTHTPSLFAQAVERAAELLRAGQLVALPTETVYGLAANAWDPAAVARIYEVKRRPPHNPIIVHVAGLELARDCVAAWPPAAGKLAAAFWPGPLTFVLPRSPRIPDVVTAGGPTVGVRWPSHPFIQAVIRASGFPLAAPSANPATQVSPTTAAHVLKAFDGQIPLIVDGGPSQVGLESTVLDLAAAPPRLLRPGMIHAESILAVLGGTLAESALRADGSQDVASALCADGSQDVASALCADGSPAGASVPRSPGMLPRHYSPKARLVILSWRDQAALSAQLQPLQIPAEKTCVIARSQVPLSGNFARVSLLPRDPAPFARALYAELHQCDESGAALIVVEAPPPHPAWRAIADRLSRASQ
jgi:L-threonylcarbamoyladenylate synthase